MARAYSTFTVEKSNEDQRTLEGYCSTPATDLAGDQVMPLGMKTVSEHVPFLWQHSHSEPIGKVLELRPTATGVWFKAKLAKISEPGVLKDRLDECWQSIREGLVRGISIGFIGDDWEPMPSGGRRFKTWILNEISAVTIPCNQECTIATVKHYATANRAANRVVRLDGQRLVARTSSPVVRLDKPITKAVEAALYEAEAGNFSDSQMLASLSGAGFKATEVELQKVRDRLDRIEMADGSLAARLTAEERAAIERLRLEYEAIHGRTDA